MNVASPVTIIAGLVLILLGLTYPFYVLLRLSRQLSGKDVPANRQLAVTLAMTALVPLTAVLAGFWLVVDRARQSPTFTGMLIGSALALVVVAIVGYYANRST